jgi:hypothetical protein
VQNSPGARRAHRDDVGIQHHKGQPPAGSDRGNRGSPASPSFTPRSREEPSRCARSPNRSGLASRRTCWKPRPASE